MDQELTHHGIKNMKWGQRRYQNPDGSLTPAGRKRYGVGLNNGRPKQAPPKQTKPSTPKPMSKKTAPDDDIPEENRYLSKKARSMSDAELDKAIARLTKEETLKRLSPEERERAKTAANDLSFRNKSLKEMSNEDIQKALDRARLENDYRRAYPEQISKGKKFLNSLRDDVIVPAVKSKGKEFAEKMLGKMMDKYFKEKPDPNSLEELRKTYDKLDYKNKIRKVKDELAGKKTDDEETAKQRDERVKAEKSLLKNDPDYRRAHPDLAKKYGIDDDGNDTETSSQSSNTKSSDESNSKSKPKSEPKSEPKSSGPQTKTTKDTGKTYVDDFEILDPEPKAKSTNNNTKSNRDDVIYDVEFTEKSSTTYNSGVTYVNQLLGLPDPRRRDGH